MDVSDIKKVSALVTLRARSQFYDTKHIRDQPNLRQAC